MVEVMEEGLMEVMRKEVIEVEVVRDGGVMG